MSPAARQLFIEQYATIRHAEGRGSEDAAYYRALPYRDLSGANREQWRIRARSFDHFLQNVLAPLETGCQRGLELLDLGAGNGWMSRHLAGRGHRVVAVDIFIDGCDGLGAIRKYAQLNAVAADFHQLPFPDRSFDAVLYNASFHYSSDYAVALREGLRCLRPGAPVVILDSPLYERPQDGETMRRERQNFFERRYGFRSEALGSIEYLDRLALAQLSRDLGIQWRLQRPWYGWRWSMRPVAAWFRRGRPPSQWFVISGTRS
jgi:SAM-dependent methyltransferase